MKIQTLVLGVVSTNCYILSNENNQKAIVIDPADNAKHIINELSNQELVPVAILLTHGHFDHIMGAKELADEYNISIYASKEEKDLVSSSKLNASGLIRKEVALTPDDFVENNQTLNFADINIRVIHTPGHTVGGVCYYLPEDRVLISGDTLFHESIGRCDLPTGDMSVLLNSIKERLFILPDEVKVYPGHGEPTTIGYEKQNNPYLNEEQFWN